MDIPHWVDFTAASATRRLRAVAARGLANSAPAYYFEAMQANYQLMYEKLGFLFYAIAAADNVVSPSERTRLREMVEMTWVPVEGTTDEFGTDAAHYIAISFDYLVSEGIGAGMAFDSFRHYYREHQALFSDVLKERIKATAQAVARAFKGENKLETAYLKKLDQLLD